MTRHLLRRDAELLQKRTKRDRVNAALGEVVARRALAAKGQHRGVSIPDLLIGACAAVHGCTVLHYDADYDRIAAATGQPVEWVVPRGSVP